MLVGTEGQAAAAGGCCWWGVVLPFAAGCPWEDWSRGVTPRLTVPPGQGGCGWGHWAPPCSAAPSAEGSEGFLACVSSGTFRGVCKKIDHFPEDADYEQDTAEYLLRESTSVRCPRAPSPAAPQQAEGWQRQHPPEHPHEGTRALPSLLANTVAG